MATTSNIDAFEGLMLGLRDILTRLEQQGGVGEVSGSDKLVKQNVITGPGSTFDRKPNISPILSSNEQQRTYKVGLELARAFFDVKKKLDTSVDKQKSSTIVASAKKTVTAGKEEPKKPESKGLGFFATLALVVGAAAYALYELFGGEGGFLVKAVAKLPQLLKLLKGFAGRIGAKLLKRIKFIPFLGAIGGFVLAYQRFEDGQWFRGILEIVSAIASMTGFGLPLSFIIDGALLLYDLSEEKGSESGMTSAIVKGSKYAAKAIFGILKKLGLKVGTKLAKVLKFVPFIGGIAGIYLAWVRWNEGEWLASIVELISAIADFIPGVGNIVSMVLDGGLLLYDLLKPPSDEKAPTVGTASTIVKGVKYAGKAIFAVLKKLGITVGTKLLKVLKFIPFVGGLAGLALAYFRWQDGEWLASIVEVISAIADFIPGVGNIVSMVLDGGLLLYDLLKTPKEEKSEEAKTQGSGWSFSTLFTSFKEKIIPVLLKALPYIPILGNMLYLYRGGKAITEGNYKEGIISILKGLFFILPPGLTDQLLSGLGMLMSLIGGEESEKSPEDVQIPKVSFISKIKEFIYQKLKALPAILRKPLEWLGILPEAAESKGGELTSQAGGGLQEYTKNTIDAAKNTISSTANAITGTIGSAVNAVGSSLGSVANTAKNAVSSTASFFGNVYSDVKTFTGNAVNSAKNAVSSATVFVGDTINTIKPFANEAILKGKEGLVNIFNNVKLFAGDTISKTGSFFENIFSDTKSFASNVASSIKNTISNATNFFGDAFSGVKSFANDTVTGAKNVISTVTGFFGDAFSGVKSFASDAVAGAKNVISTVTGFFGDAFSGVKSFASSAISVVENSISSTTSFVSDAYTKAKDGVVSIASGAVDAVKSTYTKVNEAVTTTANDIKTFLTSSFSKAKEFVSNVTSKVSSFAGNIFNGVKDYLSNVTGKAKDFLNSQLESQKAVQERMMKLVNRGIDSVKNTINKAKDFLKKGINSVKDFTASVADKAKSLAATVWSGIKTAGNKLSDIVDRFLPDKSTLQTEEDKVAIEKVKRENSINDYKAALIDTNSYLVYQNELARLQLRALHDILAVSKEQVKAVGRVSPQQVVVTPPSQEVSNNASSIDSAFNTGATTTRQAYGISPYTLNQTPRLNII